MSSPWTNRHRARLSSTPQARGSTTGRRLVAGFLVVMLGAAGLLLAGSAPSSASSKLTTSVNVNDRWNGGYCATVQITNPTTTAVDWQVTFPVEGTVDQSWNAAITQDGANLTAQGDAAWNDVIAPGATYDNFGFCARSSGGTTPTTAPPPSTVAPTTTTPLPHDTDIRTPLSTRGTDIIDADGDVVVLQGVNWFGFETNTQVVHGLWTRDYRDMLGQIASLGYNTLRIPFSIEALRSNRPVDVNTGVGNQALIGKTPIEALDVIIEEARHHGLLVMLDNHSLANDNFMHPLWYDGNYSEDAWVANWEMVASRYHDDPNVIAADLKNEPHGSASWGDGGPTDWRRAAERAGAAVQAIAPHWLIVVEGIEGPAPGQQLDRHWWGGNLEGVRTAPVRLPVSGKLVYSPHEYGPRVFAQPWFSLPQEQMEAELARRWDLGFGFIVDQGIAPVLVGEFGGHDVGDTSTVEGRWFDQFADFLASKRISWTYWSWNPNSGDTGGILDNDWRTVIARKQDRLVQLMAGVGTPPPPPTTTMAPTTTTLPPTTTTVPPTTTTMPPPTTTIPSGAVSAMVSIGDDWGHGYCATVSVRNLTNSDQDWTAEVVIAGTLRNSWNGSVHQAGDRLVISGDASWNDVIPAGGTYNGFGFCATRP